MPIRIFLETSERSARTLKMIIAAKLFGIGRRTGVDLMEPENRNRERS
jgi:hypothetical protein